MDPTKSLNLSMSFDDDDLQLNSPSTTSSIVYVDNSKNSGDVKDGGKSKNTPNTGASSKLSAGKKGGMEVFNNGSVGKSSSTAKKSAGSGIGIGELAHVSSNIPNSAEKNGVPSPLDTTIRIPQPMVQFPFQANSPSMMDSTTGGGSGFMGTMYENSVASVASNSNYNNDLIRELEAKLMKHSADFGASRPYIHPASGADRPIAKSKKAASSSAVSSPPNGSTGYVPSGPPSCSVSEAKLLRRESSNLSLNQDEKEMLREISNPMWAPFGGPESLQEKERRVNKECKNYNSLTEEERRMVVSGFKAFDGTRAVKISRPPTRVPAVLSSYSLQQQQGGGLDNTSFSDDDDKGSMSSVRSLKEQADDITPVYLRPSTHVSTDSSLCAGVR